MLTSFAESEPRSATSSDSFLVTVKSKPSRGDPSPRTHGAADIWCGVPRRAARLASHRRTALSLQTAYSSRRTRLIPCILIQHKQLKTNTTATAKQGLQSYCLKKKKKKSLNKHLKSKCCLILSCWHFSDTITEVPTPPHVGRAGYFDKHQEKLQLAA